MCQCLENINVKRRLLHMTFTATLVLYVFVCIAVTFYVAFGKVDQSSLCFFGVCV